MHLLLLLLIVSIGINILMFFPAYFLKTDKLTDISYAATYFILACFGFVVSEFSFYSFILWLMVCVWALRLGGYLLIRIRKIGKDSRFDDRRGKFWSFAQFWILQGVTVWIVMLPSAMFFKNK